MNIARIPLGLTFDDVLLVPQYSTVLPSETSLRTQFSKRIALALPFVSAAMDTVTESSMAIALAHAGGIGVIHKNCTPEEQALMVHTVKKSTADHTQFPLATVDAHDALRVAAACGPAKNAHERITALIDAGVDALVVDTAHGHSKGVVDTVRYIKKTYPHIDIIAGNIATKEAARALIKAGVHALKVGIGPGSICTTRIVAGTGVPQLTAIADVVSVARPKKVPVIADGGIKYSGDAAKALAIGASSVMLGSLFAGTEEAPGETHTTPEGVVYKTYRGMGSLPAMQKGGKERYGQAHVAEQKFVPEGIEGYVAYKGSVHNELHQLSGGVQSALGYSGAKNLSVFARTARFVRITQAGLKESHPHSLGGIKSAPNYRA